MHSGALDRVVTLQVEAEVKDPNTGQTKFQFTDVGTFAAHIKAVKMSEDFEMNTGGGGERVPREIAKEVYIFTIRYFSSLTVRHRLIFESKIFDIVGIQEVGRRAWWKIRAESIGETVSSG
jgi:head-tail adaptor